MRCILRYRTPSVNRHVLLCRYACFHCGEETKAPVPQHFEYTIGNFNVQGFICSIEKDKFICVYT